MVVLSFLRWSVCSKQKFVLESEYIFVLTQLTLGEQPISSKGIMRSTGIMAPGVVAGVVVGVVVGVVAGLGWVGGFDSKSNISIEFALNESSSSKEE